MKRGILQSAAVLVGLLMSVGCFQAQRTNLDGSNPAGFLLMQLVQTPPGTTGSTVQFVAVGANCAVWTSLDGITWTGKEGTGTSLTGCSSGTIRGVAYGNNTWVAVGETTSGAGCGLWTSSDAVTWTQKTCPSGFSNPLHSVAYGGGLWAAGGYDPLNVRVAYSADGAANWTLYSQTLGNPSTVDSIVYRASAGEFVMRSDRTGGTIVIFFTTNFASTANRTAPGLNGNLRYRLGLADGNYIVAYGADGGTSSVLSYTLDGGASWIRRTNAAPGVDSATHGVSLVSAFVHANGRYVIAHQASPVNTSCYLQSATSPYSFGGPAGTQAGCTANVNSLAYHSTLARFVGGGNGGQFGYSSTGVESAWTYAATDVSRAVSQIAVRQ